MIVFFWCLNFVISILNAWICGRSWNETRHERGWPHFMNWMGAIMSACGFTWCYTLLMAFIASVVQVEADDHTRHALLDAQYVQGMVELGYVVIILPILGSGLAITVESWSYFWRRRTFGSGAVAGYNTAAQIHNMYSAASNLPGVFRHLGKLFGGDGKKDGRAILIIVLVAVAVLGGVLTTYAIIRSTMTSVARTRAMSYGPYR